MPVAALIGTNHSHQLQGNRYGQAELFRKFVVDQARRENSDLIAEEMSEEALRRWKVDESSVRGAAIQLGVAHVFCDPNKAQRQALGIPSDEDLRRAPNLAEPTSVEDKTLEAHERSYWPIRERFWLDRIKEIEHKRSLIIVGPNHVASFASLLYQSGYEVHVICERWEPLLRAQADPLRRTL